MDRENLEFYLVRYGKSSLRALSGTLGPEQAEAHVHRIRTTCSSYVRPTTVACAMCRIAAEHPPGLAIAGRPDALRRKPPIALLERDAFSQFGDHKACQGASHCFLTVPYWTCVLLLPLSTFSIFTL